MASHHLKTNIHLPIPRVELHLFGEWEKSQKLTDGMANSIRVGYEKGLTKFSKRFLESIKRHIATGIAPKGVRWPPLSLSSYKPTKQDYPDRHLYYMTGLYYRSVGIFPYKNRMYIGLPANSRYSSGATLIKVAKWLEYGTGAFGNHSSTYESDGNNSGIPARPLWRPTFAEYGGNKKVKRVIMTAIRSQLIQDHGLNNSQIRMV